MMHSPGWLQPVARLVPISAAAAAMLASTSKPCGEFCASLIVSTELICALGTALWSVFSDCWGASAVSVDAAKTSSEESAANAGTAPKAKVRDATSATTRGLRDAGTHELQKISKRHDQ